MDIKYEIQDFITKHSSESKANFDKKITPTKYPIYGVRLGELNNFAKQILKQQFSFYDLPLSCQEEILLAGFVVAYEKIDNVTRLEHFKYILPFIDNWATCDCIVPRLKKLKDEKQYFVSLLKSKNPFAVRVGVIFLFKFYLKEDLVNTLELVTQIKNDNYYVKMAISWMIAEAFVNDFDYTINYLKQVDDKFIRNKSIQKAIESFRLTDKQKNILRFLRDKS